MHTVQSIKNFRETELRNNTSEDASWHADYKDSAYIFIGGLDFQMSEGDISIVFSQFGEISDVHLVRDKQKGKSKGFCFLAYEDQRSTILAVDNFNGASVLGRILRVDHVKKFKPPKEYLNIKEDDQDFYDKLYKPSGPDGKGWGDFRQLSKEDQEHRKFEKEQEEIEERRNQNILKNINEISNKKIILDEDERWAKLFEEDLKKQELRNKIEEMQKQNEKLKNKKIKKEKKSKKDRKSIKDKKDKKEKKGKKEKKSKKSKQNDIN